MPLCNMVKLFNIKYLVFAVDLWFFFVLPVFSPDFFWLLAVVFLGGSDHRPWYSYCVAATALDDWSASGQLDSDPDG